MRLLFRLIVVFGLAALAWTAWQMPQRSSPEQTASRRISLPTTGNPAQARQWRVITRKLVWQKAAGSIRQRLEKAGFTVIPITRREVVELYAFDDPRTFTDSEEATRVEKSWRESGIEAQVIRYDDHFGVALGRFFMPEYAETQRRLLEKSGRKYHYEQRTADIPVYRFTFPPTSRSEAEKLWQRLQDLGIADPALIREDRFASLYGPQPGKKETPRE